MAVTLALTLNGVLMLSARQAQGSAIPKWVLWPSIIIALVTYVVPGLFSSYRAWVQVRSLELDVPRSEITIGDTIRVRAVSWARTRVRFGLELVQGERSGLLGERVIPDNHNASIDPRWRRDSITVVLTPELLATYDRGPATLRAMAIGGPQWLRTPPPLIRQRPVNVVNAR